MDLYDSCIVTLSIAGTVISIPAARALFSAISISQDIIDVEAGHLSRMSQRIQGIGAQKLSNRFIRFRAQTMDGCRLGLKA